METSLVLSMDEAASPRFSEAKQPPNSLRLYLSRQASSLGRYVLEQAVVGAFGWVPSVVGVALRAFAYRLIMRIDGVAAIENGVRICFADQVRLGRGAYIDHGVYLHACPGGIEIGEETMVMHHAELHVYNFRDLPGAHIHVGRGSLIGEFCVIRGTGGVTIGDRVYLSPMVHVYSNSHVFDDPDVCFVEQGITAQGVTIEDECWIGAMAILLDGVTVGRRSVVAAGSVVTGDVPPHSLVAGAPARVVRDLREGDPARSRGFQPTPVGRASLGDPQRG
jgi:acetyltransferase-like isoleucine patch superfamily enzyme